MAALISILMPVKNAEPFLAECIDSILSQSFKDWELIAVDDGSTDGSLKVLKNYEKSDHRITVHSNDGTGIIDALRLAYSHAQGEMITRMDADDLMTNDKLEVLQKNLQQHGTGHLAVGGVKYFSTESLGDGYKRYEQWLNGLTAQGDNFTELYRECVIPSPCWMLHRQDFEQAGAFDSDLYPEDYDLAFRMQQADLEVIPCSAQIHLWRDHPERSSRNDPNYLDNSFIKLKCHHFMSDHYEDRPLVVWGAGKKGKSIIQHLKQHLPDLYWITENEKKIGHNIYGVIVDSPKLLEELFLPQVIVAIANPEEQAAVDQRLFDMGLYPMVDYFLFC
jgi:glycosyltransferase involved in cell wall biosynthesis